MKYTKSQTNKQTEEFETVKQNKKKIKPENIRT